ncbi:unnamed protein product [Porites lobata]|uniref:Uncharacterized protein n=1 Tax=Porites lobata TaxID=104759 RepID=A0ABN8NS21_9CNID|nr:unnamed protein product [Porites lobata]
MSKGEDMDACLGEVNKDSKVWQHGKMIALDWLRIFRNLGNLSKVRNWFFTMVGLQNPKEGAIESRRKYDFGDEVLAWRIKLRKERQVSGNCSEKLISLDGLELEKDLPNYEEILQSNRRRLLSEQIIDCKKRTEVEVQRLYVTVQERAVAEDIKNATKDEILKRIGDKLQQIFDGEVRGPLSSKLEYFKAHPSKAKKDALLVLYNDIIEELQHLEAVDEQCIVEDDEDGEVKAPSGTPFIVRKEAYNEYDPFALACLIPAELELIPEPLRKMAIYSKSKRKSYTLEDVRGSQIGRIQYFLNMELSYLLECGKISRIEG